MKSAFPLLRALVRSRKSEKPMSEPNKMAPAKIGGVQRPSIIGTTAWAPNSIPPLPDPPAAAANTTGTNGRSNTKPTAPMAFAIIEPDKFLPNISSVTSPPSDATV